jgi:cell division transport system permease protein
MAVASISTVALSMAILGTFLLMVIGTHRFAEHQLERFEIAVYLPVGADQTEAERVRDEISGLSLTHKVTLLSRDEEWVKLKRKLNTNIDLGGITNNPLPYAINVECKDSRKTSELADQIGKIKGIDTVNDYKQLYGSVKTIADLIRILGFAASIILCLTTTFIISNAIRLTVFARRHEIKIMQLVGATNWFIRVPLVLEGIVIGAAGALIAFGLITVCSHYTVEVIQQHVMPMLRDISSGVTPSQFMTGLTATGAIIGALGSMISIRRFLKV